MSDFPIPAGVAPLPIEECDNCHSPTEVADLDAGICKDCRAAAVRAISVESPTPEAEAFVAPTLDLQPVDDLEARRARRREVRDAAVGQPAGWIQHAIEAVREECVRARTGHEFTADTIRDIIDRRNVSSEGEVSLQFIMEEAVKRGWCEDSGRTMPSRREDTQGKQQRIYRSLL